MSIIDEHFLQPVDSIGLDDEGDVVITFANGQRLVGIPMGDCCAHTEVEEITGELGEDRRFIGIKTASYESTDTDKYEVTDDFVEVITIGDKDIAVLCKCYHNGYYSGWLEWCEGR